MDKVTVPAPRYAVGDQVALAQPAAGLPGSLVVVVRQRTRAARPPRVWRYQVQAHSRLVWVQESDLGAVQEVLPL